VKKKIQGKKITSEMALLRTSNPGDGTYAEKTTYSRDNAEIISSIITELMKPQAEHRK